MKKEMSSFDVRSVVNDMATLKDAHMDKIFQWGSNVLFRINVQGQGKKDIFFKDKKWLYMPANKPETPITPQSFATFLRKYLVMSLLPCRRIKHRPRPVCLAVILQLQGIAADQDIRRPHEPAQRLLVIPDERQIGRIRRVAGHD